MKRKTLRAQFNDMCVAGIMLDMETVSIIAGERGKSMIQVTEKGINIQPGPGNPIILNSLKIKGPMHEQSSLPLDYLPTLANLQPRKRFDLPLLLEVPNIVSGMVTYTKFAASLL